MRERDVRIGVVGYGAMGRAHSYAYAAAPALKQLAARPRRVALCGRDGLAVAAAASAYGFDRWTTDWQALVEADDIDVVDICTPPGTHAEIVEAAALNGKAVICEKPLAVSAREAADAAESVARAGVLNAIGFNYRYLPAVALMHELVASGAVGDVLLWRATWLSDEFLDPAIPYDWRFDPTMGGSTFADLGAHLVDMALWMVGPIAEVCGQSATFVTSRRLPGEDAMIGVEVDEASSALLKFASGARGVLEVARTCARRPCDFTVEVNGTLGTIVFEYAHLNELRFGRADDDPHLYGMRVIRAEHPTHPYAPDWWAIGQGVGYGSSFVNLVGDLLRSWPEGPWQPDLQVGLRVQLVCDAMEQSARKGNWVAVGPAPAGVVEPGVGPGPGKDME